MIIYLDNLRGFNDEFVELKDVNFLVGENSTGKTSLISIISLLADSGFVLSGQFRNKFVDFGSFKEIININSKNKSSFSIGIINQKDVKNFDIKYDSIFLSFTEEEGFAVLNTYYLHVKNYMFCIEFKSGKTTINIKNIDCKSTKEIQEVFSDLRTGDFNSQYLSKSTIQSKNIASNRIGIKFMPSLIQFVLDDTDDKDLKKVIESLRFGYNRGNELLGEKVYWFDPIRSKPERFYEPNKSEYSPVGEHIPTLLRDIYKSKTSTNSKRVIDIIERFGKATGLFDKIIIDPFKNSIESPFELKVKLRGKEIKISNIGYGVSQILPILTEIAFHKEESIFLIQQPEVHLHPKSQAYCGEFFFMQSFAANKNFIIETHSDFILDRFRLILREKNNEKERFDKRVNILFFESTPEGNKIHKIELDEKGNYINQPESFRKFFLNEDLRILGIDEL